MIYTFLKLYVYSYMSLKLTQIILQILFSEVLSSSISMVMSILGIEILNVYNPL